MDADVQTAASRREREQLAKEWLLRMIERTDLADVGVLPVAWVIEEGPALIGEILASIDSPPLGSEIRVDPKRAARLTDLREGADAPAQIPRDLAALQRLLIETLRREIPERRHGDFARAVERLAEAFGAIQGDVGAALVEERTGGARLDPLTGLPGRAQLDEWLRIRLAELRRYRHPFAVALIDVDGLGRINDAYGERAGDRMLIALSGVIRRQIRGVDQAFRLGDDEFCVLAPCQRAEALLAMAERVAALITESQASEGPRIAIAAGVASCPDDGESTDALFAAAEQALYAAKAAGADARASANGSAAVQDR